MKLKFFISSLRVGISNILFTAWEYTGVIIASSVIIFITFFILESYYSVLLTYEEIFAIAVVFIAAETFFDSFANKYSFNSFISSFLHATFFVIAVLPVILISDHEQKNYICAVLSGTCYLYYLLLLPLYKFIFNVRCMVRNQYKSCGVIVVLEENYSNIMSDVLEQINNLYKIKLIINYSKEDISFRCKSLRSIQALEKYLVSMVGVFNVNAVRKIIYIAAEPEIDSLKELVKISAQFNMHLFRSPYLDGIIKENQSSSIIIPISSKDITDVSCVSTESRGFVLNNFMNKYVWISYNGENIIKSLILEISKARVSFLSVFVTSENLAVEVLHILSKFNNLPYNIKLCSMYDAINLEKKEKPDIIIKVPVIKDRSLSYDNLTYILLENSFNTISLIESSMRAGVKDFFLLSDTSSTYCSSWVGITQRIAEMYAKLGEYRANCHVIRVPFNNFFAEIKTMEHEILYNGFYNDVLNKKVQIGTRVLNSVIQAMQNSKQFQNSVMVVHESDEISLLDLYKLLLNIYGLKFLDNNSIINTEVKQPEVYDFTPLKIELEKTELDNIYVENLSKFYDKNIFNSMIESSKNMINTDAMSSIVEVVVNTLGKIT